MLVQVIHFKRNWTIVLCILMSLPITLIEAQTYNIDNKETGALCPGGKTTRGDREFDGNGPDITCTAKLRISTDKRSLWVDVSFKAKETKSDWSTIAQDFSRKLWDAPGGKRIVRILSDKYSEIKFKSPPAGFQLLGPGRDFKKWATSILDELEKQYPEEDWPKDLRKVVDVVPDGDNHVVVLPPGIGSLVKNFQIVGDTGGDDISDDGNCKDDTRIVNVKFNRIRVQCQ